MIDLLQSLTIAGLTVAVVLQVLSSRNHHERIKMLEAEKGQRS